MAITNENGGLTGSDALAIMNATGGNRGGSNGFGNMFDGNNMWWIILLFIILGWNNNGNNANGGGYGMPYVINAGGFGGNDCGGVQAGFNQQAIMNGISGLQNSVSTGFGNAEVSRCNQQANVLQTLNANQNATIASMNGLAMGLQNCCCENRAGLADLKYTVATENCADRNALSEGLYQLTAQMNANQNALVSMFNTGIREIKDEFCQDRLDRKDEIIAGLRQDLQNARFDASQVAQTARFDASQAAQTTALEQYLNPTPIPAYIVQNPNCCGNNGYTCASCA